MDYFNARHFTNALGRFNSPDPANAGADPLNPQSWNGYSYVMNDPLALVDPTGTDTCANGQYADVCVTAPEPPDAPVIWFYWPWPTGGGPDQQQQPTETTPPPTRESLLTSEPTQHRGGLFTCASEFARRYSIAGAVQHFGIGRSGVSGFITNALGGDVFSGATDLIQSFRTGSGGGHSVFYNMSQGVAAGPALGFGAAFGKRLEGTPWTSGPAEVTTRAILDRGFSVATGAGEAVQTLNGAAELGSIGLIPAELVSGVAAVKLAYDFLSYAGGLAGCGTGLINPTGN